MSIFSWIYQLLIGPLELLFEIIYSLSFRVCQNPGLSIIALSLLMNFLVLPLYKRADAMQAEQREQEAALNPGVEHIRKTFQGDERYMMLQTFYRQNHYKPTYALRGSVSLLLEIPFFMAAYNMLSGLNLLHGTSFGPISDLGAPDGMLVLGSLAINVLPILMTVINLVNTVFYTKGLPFKSKFQLYLMAGLFLVLLYDSPAGLVFYWTLNNVFSLVKTLLGMTKKPRLLVSAGASALSLAGLVYVNFIYTMPSLRSRILASICLIILQLPLVSYLLSGRIHADRTPSLTKTDRTIFYGSCLFMAVLTGLLIPSTVIKASPEEFINLITFSSPLSHLSRAAVLAAGTFLVWFVIFYKLASPAGKKLMGFCMMAVCVLSVVDFMFFSTDLGLMNAKLQYHVTPAFSLRTQLINLALLGFLAAVVLVIFRWKSEILKAVIFAGCIAAVCMSLFNVYSISSVVNPKIDNLVHSGGAQPTITLNRHGKNVVVIMMDRAINSQIPYILQEKPEVARQFEGFTYYPNAISYGGFTNIGTPPLYGGYEYTPEEMNRRDQEPLVEKHNEALRVMPVSFADAGYQVTVCDPSYAGYNWIPDISIYRDHPEIKTYLTMYGAREANMESGLLQDRFAGRNFFCFSLFRISPVVIQPLMYMDGIYHNLKVLYPDTPLTEGHQEGENQADAARGQQRDGIYVAEGMNDSFLLPYHTLENLPRFTHITDSSENSFMMMSNDTTHDPMLLKVPEYVPASHVDNRAYEAEHADRFLLDGRQMAMNDEYQVIHYHANMASMIQLGKWLDYLREQNVYDNTRIIIVSDHGTALGQFDDVRFGENSWEEITFFNPLLLVKDFDSTQFRVDPQFMTQADVPTIAFSGLIEDPVNPATGKPINSDAKHHGPQHILFSYEWDVNTNNGTTFLPGYWYSVKDDIFDLNNWECLTDHPLSLAQ